MRRNLTLSLIAALMALPAGAVFARSMASPKAAPAPLTIPLLKPGTDRIAQGIPPQEPPGASPSVAAKMLSAKTAG